MKPFSTVKSLLPVLLLLLAPGLAAQTIDKASAAVLDQIEKDMKGLTSLSLEIKADINMTMPGQKDQLKTRHGVAMQRPNKMAIRLLEGPMGLHGISDGKTLSVWMPDMGEYTQGPAPEGFGPAMGLDSLPVDPSVTGVFMINDLLGPAPKKHLLQQVQSVTHLGESTVNGIKCHHLKVDYGMMVAEWHIRKQSPVMFVQAYADMSAVMMMPDLTLTAQFDFINLETNPKLADKTFHFAVPKEARKVDAFSLPDFGEVDLTGQPAPQATLHMMDGSKKALRDLWKEKPVVLDFWAVWCKPCHLVLPDIDKLAKDFEGKAHVIAVNLDIPEEHHKVEPFLKKKGLTLPVALDSDGQLGASYAAMSIPMAVVIGTDGIIHHVHFGYTGMEAEQLTAELNAMLKGKK